MFWSHKLCTMCRKKKMKKFIANFDVSVNVYSEIEANSIEEVRDLIKEELTDVNSYFMLPPLLNKTPDKQKYLNTQLHAIDTALCAEIENF